MATKFQIKRTSVSGRTPNTTNSANSSYIAAGELALNLTDKKMYSSNGTNYFEIGSFKVELVNSTSNVSTFTEISTLQFDEDSGFDVTNPSSGIAKVAINSTFKFWQVDGVQKLTAAGLDTVNFIGGNNISITANGANTPQSIAFATSMTPTFTSVTFGNSTVNTTINSSAIAVSKIFANGVVGTAGKVLTANGTGGIYWGDAAGGGGGGDLTIISDTFNGNGSNTVFTLSVTTTTDKTFVYLNGVLQTPTTDYSVANTTLTFITAPPSDNVIEVRTFDIPSVADLTVTSDNFTGNGSNTQFTLTTSLSSDETSLVFLNGVAQVPTTDYSISGSTLTFTAAPANGTNIQVTSYTAEDISTTTYTGNGSNTEFTLGTTSTTSKTVVTLNGVTQTPVTDYSVSGATLVFAVAPANNDKIVARSIPSTASSTAGGNTHIQYNKSGSLGGSAGFTFNETTNNVTIANTLTVPNLRINASNPPANSTSTGVTGTIAWDSSYIYVAVGTNTWKKIAISETGAAGGGGGSGLVRDSFTGNGSNVNFTLSKEPANEAQTLVFVDRVLQRDADYSLSGTTLTFAGAPDNSAEIDVYISDPATTEVAGANTNIIFNDSDFANGSAAFTFNKATNTVALSNTLTVGSNLTINTSTIFIGNSTVNTTIIAGNVDLQGTQLRVGNVVVNGGQLSIGNVTITDTQITVGNSTVNTVLGSTGSLSGNGSQLTSVNAIALQGNSVSDILVAANTAANTLASAAFTNAASYADTVAATAFTNAASRADAAYSNAASYADTKAGQAYSNAIAYSGNAVQAYNNAVSYAASNTYVNNTFLPLSGGTLTGALTINATANIVSNLSANNVTFRGNVQIDGNLIVSGTSVTLNVASFAVEDNILHLNNGSTETHPDIGLAGNYNDGTYKHAGIFRDATDATWKVFDGYTPEPNTAFIDTSNASFRIANFTANVITANSFSGSGASITSVDAATVGGNTASTLRTYSDTVAATAFSNAATRADSAYSNAVAYAASNSYVNSTFLPLSGGTLTGTLTVKAISSNGSVGTAGQLLASNGTSTYWIDPPASTNVNAQYTWTNTHTFANTITFGNSTVNTVVTSTSVSIGGNTLTVGTTAYYTSNGFIGLGTSSPNAVIEAVSPATSRIAAGLYSFVFRGENNNERLAVRSSADAVLIAQKFNGTYASPTAVTSGQNLGGFQAGGYTGAGWSRGMQIRGLAAGNWSSTDTPADITFQTVAVGSTSLTDRMTIGANGNVGIGDTTPSTRFRVSGGRSVFAANSEAYSIAVQHNSGSVGQFYIGATNAINPDMLFSNTGGTETVRFAANGNVGIGNTAPASKLRVEGITDSTGNIYARSGIQFFRVSGAGTGLSYYNSSYSAWCTYMSPPGVANCGPHGNFTSAASGHGVTSWALRNFIESSSGYGFTWETGSSSGNPTVIAGLESVTGNFSIAGTLTESSSIILKENINPIDNALDIISNIKGYTYDRKDGSAKNRAGLIAEEVEQVLPNVVQKDQSGNPAGIHYTNLIAYLVESIKELKQEIDILKGK